LVYYSNYTSAELKPIMKHLATLAATAKDAKLKSVFSKYSNANYKFTSSLPEMSGIKMHEMMSN